MSVNSPHAATMPAWRGNEASNSASIELCIDAFVCATVRWGDKRCVLPTIRRELGEEPDKPTGQRNEGCCWFRGEVDHLGKSSDLDQAKRESGG